MFPFICNILLSHLVNVLNIVIGGDWECALLLLHTIRWHMKLVQHFFFFEEKKEKDSCAINCNVNS